MRAAAPSKSHSHAYQRCPFIVAEKGSVRVMVPVRSIKSPLRICQPVPASPSSLGANAPIVRLNTSRMNKRSVTEGSRKRIHGGEPDVVAVVSEELDFGPSSIEGFTSPP